MARVPRDDPGQASDGELVVAGHAAPVPCVVRKAPQQQEGCRPDGRQLLGQVGERPLVGTRFRRVGGSLTANITAGDHVSSIRTARSAALAVGEHLADPAKNSRNVACERRELGGQIATPFEVVGRLLHGHSLWAFTATRAGIDRRQHRRSARPAVCRSRFGGKPSQFV